MWAEDTFTTVYTRALSDWTDADKSDWNASGAVEVNATNGLGANANLTATYLNKSFTIADRAKVKYEVDWTFACATGREGNFNWIQFGSNIRIAINSTYNLHISKDGGLNNTKIGTIKYGNYTTTKHISIVFDTQKKVVESLTFDGNDLTSYVSGSLSGSFNTVSTGFVRGGSVGWTLNNYITAITVSQAEQAAAQKATYAINYTFNGNVLKTDAGESVAGAEVSADNPVTIDGVKYFAIEGAVTSFTLEAGANNYNVKLRKANEYNFTVNAVAGTDILKTIFSGVLVEGETADIVYPLYINKDGVLYSRGPISSQYHQLVNVSEDGAVVNFDYAVTDIDNVVYFSEGEEIEGATYTNAGGNMNARSSKAACGYVSEDIVITNLPAGLYKATMVCYSNSSAGATQKFAFGDTEFEASIKGASNWSQITSEFALSEASDIKWLNSDSGNKNGLDFIYIQRTGDVEPETVEITPVADMITFCSPENLDFSNVEGLKAYIITDTDISDNDLAITPVNVVPAGTGVLLQGTKGTTYNVPIANTVEPDDMTGNILLAAEEEVALADGEAYILTAEGKFNLCNAGTLAMGKAYIPASSFGGSVKELSLSFAGATAINGIENAKTADNAIFNLAGQRVAQPTKGIYIVNGKKVFVK